MATERNSDPNSTPNADAAKETRIAYAELYNTSGRGSAFFTRMTVHSDRRGRGVGPEMLRQILALGFEKFQLSRIELNVDDFNTAGIRCYEKAGFRKEGLLRGASTGAQSAWRS